MRNFCLTLVFAASSALSGYSLAQPVADRTSLDVVSERLGSIETLRGEFEQTREIPALSRPLHSSGRFVISELGLYWEQHAPFGLLLIASNDGMIQKVTDQPAITVSADEQPIALWISQVLLGIFRGDRTEIDRFFDVEFEGSDEEWAMQLTPTAFPLTEAIDRIVIDGHQHIERLRIYGVAKDLQTIDFSGQRSEPDQLSEAERALYSP
jgi:hypothetical protein